MTHIQKKDNGKYKAVFEAGAGNKRKRRAKTFDKKKEAEKWLGKMITDRSDGNLVDPAKTTVSDYFERFLENNKKHNVATTTYDNYYNRYNTYIKPRLGPYLIQNIETFHIEQFFAELRNSGRIRGEGGLSESTLKKIYVLMNQCFRRANQINLIKNNPMRAIESPQPEGREVKAMSQKEVNQLLDTAKNKDIFMYYFISFAVMTGMRKSEILGLEWSDIDLNDGLCYIRKRLIAKQGEGTKHENRVKNTSSRRTIKLSNDLVSLLKKHKKRQTELRLQLGKEYDNSKNFVFCRPDGKNYYPTTINDKLKDLYSQAGLSSDYNTHTLRHTFATLALKRGINDKVVSEMLGHASVSTTKDIYSHVDTSLQAEAVEKINQGINLS
ncbi:MAG: tyrosine-type recombinase/integrase [Candidatus Woesearchaeota archaeon]